MLAGLLGFLALLLVAVPTLYVRVSTASHRYAAVDVPAAPVAIVLGAGVRDGQPTPFLRRRLDVAIDLFVRGRVRGLLMSGDNSKDDYDEVGVMAAYAVAHGVPAEVIAQDHAGFDTYDSCYRARAIFGVTRAIVVTQSFHLPRAVFVCREVGVAAWGVGDDTSRSWPALTRRLEVREVFSTGKALWETKVTRPEPHFLGPRIAVLDAIVHGT
ncbi:MAG: ElyC/SanA/YdcF family protein [Mycobacteriales bacterium]